MKRVLLAALVTAGLLGVFIANAQPARAVSLPCAATAGHVTLVVEHGDGAVIQRCVGINSSTASGEEVLASSGIEYSTVNYGALGDALCQVDNEPTSYPPTCFTSTSPVWFLFSAHPGGGWVEAQSGISGIQLANGDALGVRYDSQSNKTAPVSASVACPPPTTTPTSSPPPTAHGSQTAPRATTTGITSPQPPTPMPPTPATPTAGVLGISTLGTALSSTLQHPGPQSAGMNVTWLLASLCAGGMIGLLILQLRLRRR